MIVTELTRVYTNKFGEKDKVDVFTSYRKPHVPKTRIVQQKQIGATVGTTLIWMKLIFVLGILVLSFTILSPILSDILLTNPATAQESAFLSQIIKQQTVVNEFVQYVKQRNESTRIKDFVERSQQLELNQQLLENFIIENLSCSWKKEHGRLFCQFQYQMHNDNKSSKPGV